MLKTGVKTEKQGGKLLKTLWESCEKLSNPPISGVFHHFTLFQSLKKSEIKSFINRPDTALSEMMLKNEFSTMKRHS